MISKKKIYVILFFCALTVIFYIEKNFNHQGEWLTIGIIDQGISSGVTLDTLESGSLTGDGRLLVDEVMSFVSGSSAVGIKIPEEIEFMWRLAGETKSHIKKMALRSRIPVTVLRTLRERTPIHSFHVEFFITNKEPHFRWTLNEIPDYVNGVYPGAKIVAAGVQ